MKELTRLIKDFEESQAAFQKQAQKAFKESMKSFFIDNPEIKVIKWKQFSPYFNDGEECTFSVGMPMFSNAPNVEDLEHDEYVGEEEGIWCYGEDCYGEEPPQDARLIAAMDAFEAIQQSNAFETIAETMFGNHSEIVITAEGIKVEDYSHHD
jgi:hypothetical protein